MVKQERAVRTRAGLVRSAAAEFDRDGYAGTSLSQISKAAGVSIGAVTFHFASKADLAEAVREEGHAVTRTALERVTAERTSALRAVVDLTVELARLMEREVLVRASVRLARELPGGASWSGNWLPTVRDLLDEAHRTGQLRDGAPPEDVTILVEYLTGGAEASLRARPGTEGEPESPVDQLNRVWRLALAGVSATGDTGAGLPSPVASGGPGTPGVPGVRNAPDVPADRGASDALEAPETRQSGEAGEAVDARVDLGDREAGGTAGGTRKTGGVSGGPQDAGGAADGAQDAGGGRAVEG
ncbi:TetR family transcriptional regulator [Streptomyces sp. NPDC058664]|uniref:TetR family transcriptional regulator n=1 Tax=unclassified Streptomyces TaxID=2593676 RepID=UPI0036655082